MKIKPTTKNLIEKYLNIAPLEEIEFYCLSKHPEQFMLIELHGSEDLYSYHKSKEEAIKYLQQRVREGSANFYKSHYVLVDETHEHPEYILNVIGQVETEIITDREKGFKDELSSILPILKQIEKDLHTAPWTTRKPLTHIHRLEGAWDVPDSDQRLHVDVRFPVLGNDNEMNHTKINVYMHDKIVDPKDKVFYEGNVGYKVLDPSEIGIHIVDDLDTHKATIIQKVLNMLEERKG
jgi:hypothetical protein